MEFNANYIGGEWVASSDANRNINPSDTNEVVGEYARANAAQTQDAIGAARHAFSTWSCSGLETRQGILTRIGDELIARKDELGRLLSSEEGKPVAEGTGEMVRSG